MVSKNTSEALTMISDTGFDSLVRGVNSLSRLEEELTRQGTVFSSQRVFLDDVRNRWYVLRGRRIRELPAMNDEFVLPTVIVQDDPQIELIKHGEGRKYILNGIAHGSSRKDIYLPFKMNPQARATLVKGLRDVSADRRYCEEDMSSEFTLPEFTDIRDVSLGMSHLKLSFGSCLMACAYGLITLPITLPLGMVRKTINRFKEGNLVKMSSFDKSEDFVVGSKKEHEKKFLSLCAHALQNPNVQQRLFSFHRHYQLPEPLDMEIHYVEGRIIQEERKSKRNLFSSLHPTSNLRAHMMELLNSSTGVKRSLFTAQELENKYGGMIIQYVGGLMHTSQIAYALDNPEYDLADVEEYVIEGQKKKK